MGRRRATSNKRRRSTPLRLGLLPAGAVTLGMGGCLLSPPPTLTDPEPDRPNVNVSQVVPPLYQVLLAEHQVKIDFTVPITSESAGRRLWVYPWVNWGLDRATKLYPTTVPPASGVPADGMGGAGSEERAIKFTWQPDSQVEPGCNQFTVFLVYDGYDDFDAGQPKPEYFNKSAMITWWVNVDAPTGQEQNLIGCPGPALPTAAAP